MEDDRPSRICRMSRRAFLAGGASTAAAFTCRASRLLAELPDGLRPRRSSFRHVVVVTMENRSFDHLLGWVPGADGRQEGLAYTDARGLPHATRRLAPDFQGCGHPDPDHSWEGGRVAYAGGACDGWLRAGTNDDYAIGYYTGDDLPFLGRAALDWTVCDRYFAATMGPTFPNRLYLNAGATDRISNTGTLCTLPTIWDRLAGAGLEGPLLPLGRRLVPLPVGRGVRVDHAALRGVPRGLRDGAPPRGLLRRPSERGRGHG